MQVVAQNLDDILAGLQPLTVDWQDDISRRVIAEIEAMPVKKVYALDDVRILLDKEFDDALLICRLFLGPSAAVLLASQATGPIKPNSLTRYCGWGSSKRWLSKRTVFHDGAIFW
jgi:hypothetical protein